MIDGTTLQVLLVVFAATLIRSTFGFGEALIAVPLLALTIPIEIAAPLAVLLSITIAAVVVAQDWRKIHLRSTAWLVAPTLVGVPRRSCSVDQQSSTFRESRSGNRDRGVFRVFPDWP